MEFGAGFADEDAAVGDARGTGDRELFGGVGGLHVPHFLAGFGIDGHQAAVERAPDDLAVPVRHAAVDDAAAEIHRPLARHHRIVLPQWCAGFGVECIDLAPRRADIHHAVDHQRCGFVTAAFLGEIAVPGQAQLADVVGRDLRQRAVALLAVIAAVRRPLAAAGGGGSCCRCGCVLRLCCRVDCSSLAIAAAGQHCCCQNRGGSKDGNSRFVHGGSPFGCAWAAHFLLVGSGTNDRTIAQ